MSRRLAAWAVVTGGYGRGFADPSLPGFAAADDHPVDVVMVTRRLRREHEAAGVGAVRRAGREAWRIRHESEAP